MVFISKSKYLVGIQCDKALWIHYNAKQELPPVDEATQAIFDQGHLVGDLAKEYFPGGIEVEWNIKDPNDVIKKSKPLFEKRVPLYEAALEYSDGYARFDILNPVNDDEWDLIEVKSSSEAKEVHWIDVALQKFILENNGYKVRDCYVMVLNKEYRKQGEINIKELFTLVNVNEQIEELMPSVQMNLNHMKEVIQLKERPDIKIGPHCNKCKKWYECSLKSACWSFLPENNIFELNNFNAKGFDLLNHGVQKIEDIPKDFKLTEKQAIQKDAVTNKKTHTDKAAISSFLKTLKYPIHYFDFETINPAIPLYDGMKPYQHVPFQFSLHIQEENGEVEHFEYLHEGKDDPRPKLLEEMKKAFKNEGSVVVYYQSFERGKLTEMYEAFPEYKEWAEQVLSRFVDLYEPFSKFYYYNPEQKGSASLKATMPSLTGTGYKNLEISDGGMAMRAYDKITFKEVKPEEEKTIRKNMLKYCGQDTEGMIWIVDELKEIVED